MAEERDGNNTVTRRYYAEGMQKDGSAKFFYTRDHLGSIREMTGHAGAIRARYDYDPYGRRSANLITSNPVEAEFGFTGHYYHAPSGLHLAPYRAYDADIGRWINRDPIQEAGGLNLYGYVGNSPINFYDPYGLWWLWDDYYQYSWGFGGEGTFRAFWSGFGEGLKVGAPATIDGFIPVVDPLEDIFGAYDSECDEILKASQFLGGIGRDALTWAVGGAVGTVARGVGMEVTLGRRLFLEPVLHFSRRNDCTL